MWEKLGRVFRADGEETWRQSHAYLPTPFRYDAETIRVYCSFLDQNMIGRVGYVDVRASDPTHVISVSKTPVLSTGAPGTFDSFGVTPSSIVEFESTLGLYYFGWNRHVDIPYTIFVGLAVSDDGGDTFVRHSQTPVLDRTHGERYLRSAPFVVAENGKYRMYYVSADEWITVDDREVPTYDIRVVSSTDGKQWGHGAGQTVLSPNRDNREYGFGRPFVERVDGSYQMWYSVRTVDKRYRLGYAESDDGIRWSRMDAQASLDVSASGWDSEMVCFPALFETDTSRYLFYNGNGYGETGFGVAKLRGV